MSELVALESLAGHARSSSSPFDGIHSSGPRDAPSSVAADTPDASARKAGVQLILADATPRHQLEPLLALHRELVHRFSASRSVSPAYSYTESGASYTMFLIQKILYFSRVLVIYKMFNASTFVCYLLYLERPTDLCSAPTGSSLSTYASSLPYEFAAAVHSQALNVFT